MQYLFRTQCVLCVVQTNCISVTNLYSLSIFPQQTEVFFSVILITKFVTCSVSTCSVLCEVGIQSLHTNYVNFRYRKVKVFPVAFTESRPT
jgi:hypothetical protein